MSPLFPPSMRTVFLKPLVHFVTRMQSALQTSNISTSTPLNMRRPFCAHIRWAHFKFYWSEVDFAAGWGARTVVRVRGQPKNLASAAYFENNTKACGCQGETVYQYGCRSDLSKTSFRRPFA